MHWWRSHGKFAQPPPNPPLPRRELTIFFLFFSFSPLDKFPHFKFRQKIFLLSNWDDANYKNGTCVSSILCGDLAIKRIDQPFVSDAEDKSEWAI